VVPALLAAVKGADRDERAAALTVLAKIGPDGKEALPVLLEQLKAARDTSIDNPLALALGRQGPPAVPELVALVAGKDVPVPVQVGAAQALVRGGPTAAEAVVKLLDRDEPGLRGLACLLLRQLGPAAKGAVPPLTAALDDPATRDGAVEAIRAIGPDAAAAVPALLRVLKEDNPATRQFVLAALGEIRPDGPAAADAAAALLADPDAGVRARAAETVWLLRRSGKEAVPVLVALLKEKGDAGQAAVSVIAGMGDAAAPAVPALAELLRSKDGATQVKVLSALTRIGPPAAPAAAQVAALLPQDDGVAGVALGALAAMRGEAKVVVPALARFLRDRPASSHREEAVELLGEYGADAREAVPLLAAGLRDQAPGYRWNCAAALARVDPEKARAALPLLRELARQRFRYLEPYVALYRIDPEDETRPLEVLQAALQSADTEALRGAAARRLGELGPAAKEAGPALTRALRDESGSVRLAAALALGRVGGHAEEVVVALAELVQEWGDPEVRWQAAAALGRMGAAAGAAAPALRSAKTEADPLLRQVARDALRKITP
jgi:HEAT repeat protein